MVRHITDNHEEQPLDHLLPLRSPTLDANFFFTFFFRFWDARASARAKGFAVVDAGELLPRPCDGRAAATILFHLRLRSRGAAGVLAASTTPTDYPIMAGRPGALCQLRWGIHLALDQDRPSAFATLAAQIATAITTSHFAAARIAPPVVGCNHGRQLAGGWAVPAPATAAATAATDVPDATTAARFGGLALDCPRRAAAAAAAAAEVASSLLAVGLMAVGQAESQQPDNGTRAALVRCQLSVSLRWLALALSRAMISARSPDSGRECLLCRIASVAAVSAAWRSYFLTSYCVLYLVVTLSAGH